MGMGYTLVFHMDDKLGACQFKAFVLLGITNMPVAPGAGAFFLWNKVQMVRKLKCVPQADKEFILV